MSCKSLNETKTVFKDEKVEVSDDDIKGLAKILKLAIKKINSMKEEELQKFSSGSPKDKVLNFAHYPVDHTVSFINRHISDNSSGNSAKEFIRGVGDFADTAIDISLWAGLIYGGYKGLKHFIILQFKKDG